jgi:hypothetical protein
VVDHVLAMGEPSDEIIKFVRTHSVDLIAMSTHGHRFISDLLYGSTADKVRHLGQRTGAPPQGEELSATIESVSILSNSFGICFLLGAGITTIAFAST